MEGANFLICGNLEDVYSLKFKTKFCILDTKEELTQRNAYFKNLELYNSVSQLPSTIKVAYIPKISLIAYKNSYLRQELLEAGISVVDELPMDINQIKDCLRIANNKKIYYITEIPGFDDEFFEKCVDILYTEAKKSNVLYIDGIFSDISLYYILKILKEGLGTNQKIKVTNYYNNSETLTLGGYILNISLCVRIYHPNVTKEYKLVNYSDELKIFTKNGCITMDCINRKISYNNELLVKLIDSIDRQELKSKHRNELNINTVIDTNMNLDLISYRSQTQEVLNDFAFMEEIIKLLSSYKTSTIGDNETKSYALQYLTFKDKFNTRHLCNIDKEVFNIEKNYSFIQDDYLIKYKETLNVYILEEIFNFFIKNGIFTEQNIKYTDDFIIKNSFEGRNLRIIKRWLDKLISGNFIECKDRNFWSIRDSQKNNTEKHFYELRKLWDWKLGSPYSLEYIRKNIKHLKGLFDGDIDCNTILFPESDIKYATAMYKDNIIYRFLNEIIGMQVVDYVNKYFNEKYKKTTILEVGAGIGATTDSIIEKLQNYNLFNNVNYLYTDISNFFLDMGKEKYKGNPRIHYLKLNIDNLKELESLKDIDIVVAAGVLNNSRNLEGVMKVLLKKIKPNGMMLITEPMDEPIEMLVSQVFMMEKPNDIRNKKNSTFLGIDDWLELINRYGDFEVSIFPRESHNLNIFGQKLFIIK